MDDAALGHHAGDAARRALAAPGAGVPQLINSLPPAARTYAAGFCWAATFTTELLRAGGSARPGDLGRGLRLRVATRGDAATIMRFVSELAEFEKAAPGDLTNTAAAMAADGFDDGLFHCFIAEVDAAAAAELALSDGSSAADGWAPVAFALAHPSYSTWQGRCLYVEDVYVVPSARRRGVSRLLFAALARAAAVARCARMQWSVLAWNAPAIGAYDALGAEALRDWGLYRVYEDGIAMLAGTDSEARGGDGSGRIGGDGSMADAAVAVGAAALGC
jgi:GNAT superfamily N-acetyltransferase